MSKSQEHNSNSVTANKDVSGGCHCGAVRFVAKVPDDTVVLTCNCSICAMTGFQHLIVKHEAFTLLSGENQLTSYKFNTQQANHLFCSICSIKSYYQPRSHPDSWSINTNCIDDFDVHNWRLERFDGQNWEQAKEQLDDT